MVKFNLQLWVDKIIVHESLNSTTALRLRAAMATVLIVFNIFLLTAILAMIQCFVAYSETYYFAIGITVFINLAFITAYFFLRFKGWYYFSVILVYTALYASICAAMYITGGPEITPFKHLVIIMVVAGFFFFGHRYGLLIAGFTFSIQACAFYLSVHGYPYLHLPLPIDPVYADYILWMIQFLVITETALIYEVGNKRLLEVVEDKQKHFQYMANHDDLTGLCNRALFSDTLTQAIFRAQRHQTNFALLYIDLDGFKSINDTLGHEAGDAILQAVAANLMENVRRTDTVARLGGDEFCLLLEDFDEDGIEKTCQSMITAIAKPCNYQGRQLRVYSSIGCAFYPSSSLSKEEVVKYADAAMYDAKSTKVQNKRDNKNCIGQFKVHLDKTVYTV